MADDVHEIQLNGKQVVFLFMAAAVVLVVVFLSGVMVGRGVRAEKAAVAASETPPIAADPTATGGVPAHPSEPPGLPAEVRTPATAGAPPVTPPPPVAEDTNRVAPVGSATSPEPKAPSGAAGSGGAPAEQGPRPEASPKTAPAGAPSRGGDARPAASRAAGTGAPGYSVQVAAPTVRATAEAIARRLSAKGYPAFVLEPTPGGGSPVYYRVRVGPYKSRGEADEAKRRLEKEEQFKPFIIR